MPDAIAPQTALALSATEWMTLIGLGLILGALGQSVRIVVGLNKRSLPARGGREARLNLNPARLALSILIGALAGALAGLLVSEIAHAPGQAMVFTIEEVFGLAAAGYAGADFIEGLMARFTPDTPVGEAGHDR